VQNNVGRSTIAICRKDFLRKSEIIVTAIIPQQQFDHRFNCKLLLLPQRASTDKHRSSGWIN
jgi:hypothetical protein